MPAAFKSIVRRLVYAGLVVFTTGAVMLGKADTALIERLRLQVGDVVGPILGVLSEPVDTLVAGIAQVRRLANLNEENAQLREDRERLLRWRSVAQRLEVENAELRRLLNFVPEPEASSISARVVADLSGAFAQSRLLNAGSAAGVKKDQLVLTGEGLVGRVIGVSQRASRVLLITDISSRIPVFAGPSRVRAMLAGDNTDRPKLIHLVAGETIKPGDEVVTSGIAGVFPPGLPVGVVGEVDEARISITPNVERDRLEYVRVVDYGIGTIRVDPPMTATKPGEPKGAVGKPSVRADAR
jgi:rod shape-determining protein MreC